ncbi:MAG: zinc-finger domain-containing protein [bacterium]
MSSAPASCNEREVVVSHKDLPLHCPVDDNDLWACHPRVFIPIEDAEDHTAICPYCGTRYILK